MTAQRGQALILSILALLVLTLLGLTLTSMGMVSMSASLNEREASEALYVADAGIAHAAGVLALLPWPTFDPVLQAGDGVACTGDELQSAPDPPAMLPVVALIPGGGRAFATGSYRVSVCDDDGLERAANAPPLLPDADPNHDANRTVLVRSTGLGRNSASATVEASFARVELPGVVVDGPLRLSGGIAVLGHAGSVHANGVLDLQGSPCAEQFFSSAAEIFGAGNGLGGSGCSGSSRDARAAQPRVTVPALELAGMRRSVAYVLGADGFARSGGAVVEARGWSFDSRARRWAGDATIAPGSYYVEGNAELSGSLPPPGSPPVQLSVTLIAEGWIDVRNIAVAPAFLAFPAYTLVAGTDLRIAGDAAATFVGLFYAGDQLEIQGAPHLIGQVIVKNGGDHGYPDNPLNAAENNLVRLEDGYVALRGDAKITCPGVGLGSVLLTGWRECRGDNPDNPCGVP